MTRPADQRAEVFGLHEAGWNARQIAFATDIPRSTVKDWLGGKLPRASRSGHSCPACGHDAHEYSGLGGQYSYLLGLYLGDGCISTHRRDVYKLRITLDLKYPDIVAGCVAAMTAVMPTSKVSRQNRLGGGKNAGLFTHVDVGSYSKAWPCLFPQHGPGLKHNREIRLADWQLAVTDREPERLLCGLIHSDGCRSINTGRGGWICPRYSFHNASTDILGIFERSCHQLGLHTTRAPRTVYVSRKADVATLDTFIGPKR